MITLHEVSTNAELKAFIRFPEKLYRQHPFWVPPLFLMEWATLHWQKNPTLRHVRSIYLLAYREGRIVGRVAGMIHDLEVEATGLNHARFGWLDVIDDLEVTTLLLRAIEDWAVDQSMTELKGPVGFTHLDKAGMLVHGFETLPTMVTLYNPAYYVDHLQALGFQKDVDWKEYRIAMPAEVPDRVDRLSDVLSKRYGLRQMRFRSRKEILAYKDGIFSMIREAYRTLYDFVPLDETEAEAITLQFIRFLKPEFLAVILDGEDQVVGFGITMPSFSKALQRCRGNLFPFGWLHLYRATRRNDTADLLLIGVADEYRNKGVNALIFQQVMETFMDFGIRWVETNPELEGNTQVQAMWRRYDPKHVRTRRAWKKTI